MTAEWKLVALRFQRNVFQTIHAPDRLDSSLPILVILQNISSQQIQCLLLSEPKHIFSQLNSTFNVGPIFNSTCGMLFASLFLVSTSGNQSYLLPYLHLISILGNRYFDRWVTCHVHITILLFLVAIIICGLLNCLPSTVFLLHYTPCHTHVFERGPFRCNPW